MLTPQGDQEANEGVALQAFTVNGQVDPSFGDAGLARPPLAGLSIARADPGGGLVVAGTTSTGAEVILKLREDGRVDPLFGENGLAPMQRPFSHVRGMVVRPDGRLVVLVGTDNDTSFALLGLDPAGRSDPSFGTGGAARVEIGDAELLAGSALFLEPGGSLLVALASRNPDLDLPILVRYLADGRRASLESPFDSGIEPASPAGIALAPDGRIVMALTQSIIQDGDLVTVEPYLVRFLGDGSRDPTFGQDGIVALPFAPDDLSVDESSNVYVVGSMRKEQSYDIPVVIRYKAGGEPDDEFGPEGMLEVTLDEEGALRSVVLVEDAEPGALLAGGVRFGYLEDSGYGFLVRIPMSPQPGG